MSQVDSAILKRYETKKAQENALIISAKNRYEANSEIARHEFELKELLKEMVKVQESEIDILETFRQTPVKCESLSLKVCEDLPVIRQSQLCEVK